MLNSKMLTVRESINPQIVFPLTELEFAARRKFDNAVNEGDEIEALITLQILDDENKQGSVTELTRDLDAWRARQTSVEYHDCSGCTFGWCKIRDKEGCLHVCVPDSTLVR